MVNGKNISMFTSYSHSAAWELAHAFAALLFEPPFFTPGRTDNEAARVQSNAIVKVLRLVGEIEEAQSSPRYGRELNRPPMDWLREADRVEGFTQDEEWDALIGWAQEICRKSAQNR